MEHVAPTRERLARSVYEPPARDQQVNRPAYRVLNPFEALVMRGDLEPELGRAADKLARHWYGALRHDVRMTDVWTEQNSTLDGIDYPWAHHGAKLAEAKRHLMPSEWIALVDMIEERATLQEIGARRRKAATDKINRATGLTVISTALERLAYLWGIKQLPPERS